MLLKKLLSGYSIRERELQKILLPQIIKIKSESSNIERHTRIKNLYKRYRYSPIYSFRTIIPFLVQFPFLIAAYFMLSDLKVLDGAPFLFIHDLSKPDNLIGHLNILPILMTIINIVTAFVYQDLNKNERLQAIFIALLFLILLYNAPSALLIYWTMNNALSFYQAIVIRIKTEKHKKAQISFSLMMQNTLKSLITKRNINLLNVFFSLSILYFLLHNIVDNKNFSTLTFRAILFFITSFCWWAFSILSFIQKYKRPIKNKLVLISSVFNIFIISLLVLNYIFEIVTIDYPKSPFLFYITLLFLITGLINNILTNEQRQAILGEMHRNWYLALILSSLIPSLHLAGFNTDYLSGGYYFLFFALILGITTLSYFWVIISLPNKFEKRYKILYLSVFIILYFSLPTLMASFSANRQDLIFLPALAFGLFLSDKISILKLKNFILPLLKILFIFNAITFAYNVSKSELKNKNKYVQIPKLLENLTFKENPNIYLFIYDGLPNKEVFHQQNLSFERLDLLLNNFNYKVYDKTYTLGHASLSSMGSMLNIENLYNKPLTELRDIYSGNSIVNRSFRKNGYSTYKLLKDYLTGVYAIKNMPLVDEYYPPKTINPIKKEFFVTLFRGMLQGMLKFDTQGLFKEKYSIVAEQKRKHEIIKMTKEKSFVVNHYKYPGHSQNSGRLLPNETELWLKNLDLAILKLEQDLKMIEIYDPNALVILAGDHGPYLTGDGYLLKNYDLDQITAKMIWDRIGCLIAIKWPDRKKAEKYDNDLILLQDVFPVVFSYLSDTSKPLDFKLDRTFTGFGNWLKPNLKFREGKLLSKYQFK